MSTAKRVIKNTGFLYAKMGITLFISLYTTRLVLNALGASDFGIFSIVGGAIAMLGFLDASLASATQRFMSYAEGEGDKEKQKKIFNISFVLHFFIALLLGVILLVAGYFFFHGILNIEPGRIYAAKVVYSSLIISTMFTVMTVPYDAVLNARENMFYYAIVGIIESVLKLAVAFAVVYMAGDKLVIYGVLMALIPLLVMTIMRVYCHKKYEECVIAPRKYWDKKLMKEMRAFAGWNLLGSSSGLISGYGSNIVLNSFFGTILNAANGVSGQLNGQLLALSNNMTKAVNPVIVKEEGKGNRQKMFQASFSACKISVCLYSLIAIPFIIESPLILKLWLIKVPPYTLIFIQLMTMQVLFEEISLPLGITIGAVGNIKKLNIITSVVLYSQILLLFISYKLGYPPQMLRIIQIVGAAFLTGYKIFYCSKVCGMSLQHYMINVLVRSFAAIISTFIIVTLIQQTMSPSITRIFITCTLSVLIFSFLIYTIGLTKDEKMNLKNIVRQIKLKYA